MNKVSGNILYCISIAFLLSATLVGYSQQSLALEVHKNISGPFASIKDITITCIKCHHEQAIEVLQSPHWTWVRQRNIDGAETLFSKKESLTGFAIDVSSNPSRCLGCHISNTRPDVHFDTPSPEQVDCLACHDTTNTYRVSSTGTPGEKTPQDLMLMARNVGRPSPANCTTCHFADCGLSAVAQPDISFQSATPFLNDIHMNQANLSFTCQDCHNRTSGHILSRKIHSNDPNTENGCAACHTLTPHDIEKLNSHTTKISCQTCHIP